MNVFIAALTLGAQAPLIEQASTQDWLTVSGVRQLHVTLESGAVDVLVPADMMNGETISGSVFFTPSRGGVAPMLAVGGKTVSTAGSGFTVTLPEMGDRLAMEITDGGSATLARFDAPMMGGAMAQHSLRCAPIATVGGALHLSGPFDGSRNNTNLALDGRTMGVLTESPRGCTVSVIGLDPGQHTVMAREGAAGLASKFNVVHVQAIAPGTRLRRGMNDLDVSVTGLEGVPSSAYPLEISMKCDTPDVLQIVDSRDATVFLRLSEANVVRGTGAAKVRVKAVKNGSFQMTAFSYSRPYLDSILR